MLDSWLSLPVGLLIATIVSIIGIGGGILWMPFFLIVLKLRPDVAVITSLYNSRSAREIDRGAILHYAGRC